MKRKLRLTSSQEIRRVYAARRPRPGALLTVHAVPNAAGRARFAFAVSSKLGGAVVRNRLRRRLRAAALASAAAAPQCDVVVVARPPAVAASVEELTAELRSLLAQVAPPPATQGAPGEAPPP